MSKLSSDPLSLTGTTGWGQDVSVRFANGEIVSNGAYLQTMGVQFESVIFNVGPFNHRLGREHVSFNECRHVHMIMVVHHAALLAYAHCCLNVVSRNHTARNMSIEQVAYGRSGSRLELVLEDDEPEEPQVGLDFLSEAPSLVSIAPMPIARLLRTWSAAEP